MSEQKPNTYEASRTGTWLEQDGYCKDIITWLEQDGYCKDIIT
jgi:DNA-binding FrmR family transcriptional regulator